MMPNDTIYALSSGGLPSGVAVIRMSGPQAESVAISISGALPSPRVMGRRTIRTRNGNVLDEALVVVFPAPASFTGETCVELHLHGGRATVAAVLDLFSSYTGLRHAEAGEFTRRALANGKMDLAQAEGLGDLLEAETEAQRRLAQDLTSGHLSVLYRGWAERILHARAMIEAELDFADEEDVPGSVSERIWADVAEIADAMGRHLDRSAVAAIARDGLRVVIHGPPNAGKSSLINSLSGDSIAIVTDVAGTTRDILTTDLVLNGFAIRLFDTAGIQETQDVVEAEGIRRAELAVESADVILSLSDSSTFLPLPDNCIGQLIRVRTKIDVLPLAEGECYDVAISVVSGTGMDRLRAIIGACLPDLAAFQTAATPARRRHAEGLKLAHDELTYALKSEDLSLELRSEHLRRAATGIGRITGQTNVDDLLDVIFTSFCIGK
ncbi:tRNA modification GTPase trmE [Rhizobium sp. RU20A]|uniref:tRNA uridine-5-carboxymethylaminomethyl(34) synthesis GTPase MnmE n=1 Tax=Rhizobium sp. RU20A TaxID=1907412 RepID=UPI0009564E90|nr:tRNA uridine-5-carboxymethylaminomethyl(34) synthesis GTPase MnmE [Rhizobium sp. RU20A]SIQ84692.1 tRNA modification GTPase trmE [Rhizobium sp. RU20A]